MRRFLAATLIFSVTLFIGTFAGLSVFGMTESSMEMGAHDCAGTACAPMADMGHAAADGVNCINHCLAAASVPSAPVLPPTVAFVLVFFFAILPEGAAATSAIQGAISRLRDGIPKYLLHRQLSTIVLRN